MPGVFVGIDRRFENEGFISQFLVGQNAGEACFSDLAFADVFVPIQMRTQRSFGIVGVEDLDLVEPEYAVGCGYCCFQTGGGGDIEARGQKMAGIKAIGDREASFAGRQIPDHSDFFETLTDPGAASYCVFEKHGQAGGTESRGGFGEAQCERRKTLFERLVFIVTRMEDKIVCADGFGAVKFATEGCDRLLSYLWIERGQVDEVIGVDHERREIQPLAGGFEAADIVWIRRGSPPHARTGGEDLEGIGAETVSFEAGVFEGFCA